MSMQKPFFHSKSFSMYPRNRIFALGAAMLLAGVPAIPAQQPTEKEMVDAILGRTSPPPGSDLNSDGNINVQDLVLLLKATLDGQDLEVFFAQGSSIAKSWEGSHEVEIAFSKPATGELRLAFAGSGTDATDWALTGDGAVSGESRIRRLQINNATSVKVPIPLKPANQLRRASSLLITLGVPSTQDSINLPEEEAESKDPAQRTRFGTHEVRIVDHAGGLFSGVINFPVGVQEESQNGENSLRFSAAAPLGPIAVKFAQRGNTGLLEIMDHPFLPQTITLASAGLPEGASASGNKEFTFPASLARPSQTTSIIWQLDFGSAQDVTVDSETGDVLTANLPVTLRLKNMTAASDREVIAAGQLVLSRLESITFSTQ
jgi:hypothetical protein